ncbi:MAG: MarR family winged helix-turn-helix transcriptional regulator [Gammaproteobacteria bacterium]
MNTKSAEPDTAQISDSEEEVLRSLRRIIRAVDLYSRKLMAQTGLSGPQVICLRQLASSGAMRTKELAEAVNLSSATVCGILDRLEQRGLVLRERQSNDRRCVMVRLSDAGAEAVNHAPPALHDSFLFKLRALPASQQQSIRTTLTKIVAMMAADELDAAPILVPGESVTAGPDRKT